MKKETKNKTAERQVGPIELIMVIFPGHHFSGGISTALQELVEDRIITIIDILFVRKDEKGRISVLELTDLDLDDYQIFDVLVAKNIAGMLTDKDAKEFAKRMDKDSTAAVMLFEDTWAMDLSKAVEHAHGDVVVSERIPKTVVKELLATR